MHLVKSAIGDIRVRISFNQCDFFFFIDERSICELDVSSFSPQYNIVMLQMFLDQFIKSAHFVDQLNG